VADIEPAARSLRQEVVILNATSVEKIDAAFATAGQQGISALLINADAFFNARRAQITALAARHRIPTIYGGRLFAEAGGLLSYSDDRVESYRLAGTYVGRVLKGEKPADLPVLLPTKFELVINLKTAKELGITVPATMLGRADEVIE
jgi:putative ABC transport system substrate-binding protein